jgi:SAM-dependent methyltransferase
MPPMTLPPLERRPALAAGFLRDEFAAFLSSRYPESEAAADEFGRLLHMFILMMQSRGGEKQRADRGAGVSEREGRLRAFFERAFADPVKSSPLFFITHGLSFLNYLEEQPFARPSLEIGCESGYDSALLFQEPFDVGAQADVLLEPLLRERGMHRMCVTACAEKIPLPDASVATAVLNNTIYRSRERERVFAELYRILKPGGRLFFDDITADICAMENRPAINFMRQAGGRDLVHRFMRARGDLCANGHTINPFELLTAEEYPEHLARFGFRHARTRYFCSPELTRLGYATHDAEYLFGLKSSEEIAPWYRRWLEDELLPLILDDRTLAAATGGSFVFVTAEK